MIPRDSSAQVIAETSAPALEAPPRAIDSCAVVVFGGAGDLARRKLIPALYNLSRDGALPKDFALVGTGRTEMSSEAFRALHREATAHFSRTPLDPGAWDRFAASLEYVSGDYGNPALFSRLRDWLGRSDREHGTGGNRLFYCATPSSGFPEILDGLVAAGLLYKLDRGKRTPWSRVVIEKPFGHDLASANELDNRLASKLDESQVFRIDHYLGKETVQNILVFRFGNTIFEPLWNRKYIDHVQVTAAEEIGIEGRGRFYDETGVLRDIVQNHLLQVLALCAMEPPASLGADEVRDQKALVFRSLRPFKRGDVERRLVLGQYRGYREEPHVAPDSRTPTYAALEVYIDNWRWQGVPFYLRAGKRLAKRVTEIAVRFQQIPLCLFTPADACRFEPDVLCLRIQPDEGITLRFACKPPGDVLAPRNVTMDFSYARGFDAPVHEAYERLLLDVMRGDATLFWRRDEVERSWEFMTPILEGVASSKRDLVHPYEPGSEGPSEADALIDRQGRFWRELR
jgi:glucose-6-phosphate 1-dehydrogenase